ncbi:MAG: LysM peptidoglycan-binding domain-containing protein [Phycisphaerales bacterium]|nr:MAG: LysM peptidoglycan-binding domain-containing protein [Phycisphaerales bacterium]
MSRENKLALVLGFGLILFVGILISDHFSTARRQQAAELGGIVDPIVAARQSNAELIDHQLPSPAADDLDAGPALHQIPPAGDAEPARQGSGDDDGVKRVTMGEPARKLVDLPPEQAAELPYTPHHVQRGETLISICQRYYGDGSLAEDLARYNGISDPGRIREGHRLRLPPAEALVRGAIAEPSSPPNPAGSGPAAAYRTYVIKSGDNLSEIAQRELGSATRYLELYELNRDVLESPDRLVVGTKIRIPRSAGRGQ